MKKSQPPLSHEQKKIESLQSELAIINKEFVFQEKEKNKQGIRLVFTNKELVEAKRIKKLYLSELNQIQFMISHEIRQPVCNILGLSDSISQKNNSVKDQKRMTRYIKQSALSLDKYTKKLSLFIQNLIQKFKKNPLRQLPK